MKVKFTKLMISILFLILIWFLVYLILRKPIVPSPFIVFFQFKEIFIKKIVIHIFFSLFRIFCGIILAVLVGFPVGLFVGYYKNLDEFFSPIISLIYPIPKIALLPILMLLFGLGEITKILVLFLVIVFQIIVSIKDHIKNIDEALLYPLISLNASDKQIFNNVLIPYSYQRLFTSIKVSIATSLSILFFSENYGTTKGLGFFIVDSMMRVDYIEMYCGIITLSLLGLILFSLTSFFENKFNN